MMINQTATRRIKEVETKLKGHTSQCKLNAYTNVQCVISTRARVLPADNLLFSAHATNKAAISGQKIRSLLISRTCNHNIVLSQVYQNKF